MSDDQEPPIAVSNQAGNGWPGEQVVTDPFA
jgi:hypothetical protein